MGARPRRLFCAFLQFVTGIEIARMSGSEVNMNPMRLLAATALLSITAIASAQIPDTSRGNTPPGMSRDGSAPGAGAITGGSIAPGERSGVPSGRDTNSGREESLKRCNDLEGMLREQCLRNAESAGSGSTTVPATKAPMGGSDIEPRLSPPPQNPR
jgi:hypothetical protein